MWNVRTGEVWRAFPFSESGVSTNNIGQPSWGWRGLIYSVKSSLLVAEGYIDGGEGDTRTRFHGRRFYLWDGQRFVLLYEVLLPAPGPAPVE